MNYAAIQWASHLINQNRHTEAEKELRAFLAVEPQNSSALYLLAISLIEQDSIKEAKSIINQLISKEPDNDKYFFLKTRLLLNENKIKEAEKNIQVAISFNPENADYFGTYALILLELKHFEHSLKTSEEGLKLDAENLFCLNMRAKAQIKLGRQDEAHETLYKALEKDAESEFTHANLGWTLLEKGEHNNAMNHFKESLKINPGYEYAKEGIAEAMKAKYLYYRIFMKYAFWVSKLSGSAQWGLIIGLYIASKLLRKVAEANEGLKPIIYPILGVYLIFVLSTWILRPISNLLLRLNVYGRYALSKEEIISSNFVGISLIISVIGFVIFLLSRDWLFAFISIYGFAMTMPLSTMLNPKTKTHVITLISSTIALSILGLLGIAFLYFENTAGSLFALIFIIGIIAYQYLANAMIIKS